MGNPIPKDDFTLPKTQTAVIVSDDGTFKVSQDAHVPQLKSDEFYIKTEAVAINPSDTKMLGDFQTKGGILGTDYAGTVIAVGSEVTDVVIGDRVCGATHAMHANRPDRGAFGQYNVSASKIWLKLPAGMSIEAGASLPAGLCTAGQAIRQLGLPLPDAPAEKPKKVLVYGGSTATGTLAIQLLKLAKLIPITTCSPKNFDLVKSYGAAEVYDYSSPGCAELIRKDTANNLAYTLDCITTPESTTFCYAALGRAGGRYVSLDPYSTFAANRKAVKGSWVLGPAIFGDGSSWPAPYGREGDEELRDFGTKLFQVCEDLIEKGELRGHPLRVIEGRWEDVLKGMELVKAGTLSGEKAVVRLVGV
ncbi:hypothetical protein B0A48_15444 [Cryoendolithus antarcticus]|uniref:Enoyl reductase (ER) domain-containing protein n=1 Tax=Cryoendolithus antarcticus TaxID=1507870 RepID=A0A1V8SI00_9PEZI|nr:hypothetical protein B0A48_15444 [Cryoendolithus antarcticus]